MPAPRVILGSIACIIVGLVCGVAVSRYGATFERPEGGHFDRAQLVAAQKKSRQRDQGEWVLLFPPSCPSTLKERDSSPPSLHVTFTGDAGGRELPVTLFRTTKPLTLGKRFVVRFRASSKVPTKAALLLNSTEAPFENLGCSATLEWGPAERDFRIPFTVAKESPGNLTFFLDPLAQEVDIVDPRLEGDAESLSSPPSPSPSPSPDSPPPSIAKTSNVPPIAPVEKPSAKRNSPFDGWTLRLHEGGLANLHALSADPATVRVEIKNATPSAPHGTQLGKILSPVVGGRRYTLRMRVRADRDRAIIYLLNSGVPPFQGLGLYREEKVGPSERDLSVPFVASQDDSVPTLIVNLGKEAAAVELSRVSLLEDSP